MKPESSKSDVLITIPARAGSKRLPQKNSLPLNGKPMFYYSVKAALGAGVTDKVYVLSDSQQILAQAQAFGAKTMFLPAEFASDTAGVVNASLYAIDQLAEQGKYFSDLIILQPSSPLRQAEDIIKSHALFTNGQGNSLVSIAEVDPHFFHWAVERDNDSSIGKMYFGRKFLKPRQELPQMFWPNGAIKIARIDFLRQQGNFFGEKMLTYVMPNDRSVHVATEFDFTLCSLLMQQKTGDGREGKDGKE